MGTHDCKCDMHTLYYQAIIVCMDMIRPVKCEGGIPHQPCRTVLIERTFANPAVLTLVPALLITKLAFYISRHTW